MEKRPDSAECSCNSPEMLLRRFSERVDSVLVQSRFPCKLQQAATFWAFRGVQNYCRKFMPPMWEAKALS